MRTHIYEDEETWVVPNADFDLSVLDGSRACELTLQLCQLSLVTIYLCHTLHIGMYLRICRNVYTYVSMCVRERALSLLTHVGTWRNSTHTRTQTQTHTHTHTHTHITFLLYLKRAGRKSKHLTQNIFVYGNMFKTKNVCHQSPRENIFFSRKTPFLLSHKKKEKQKAKCKKKKGKCKNTRKFKGTDLSGAVDRQEFKLVCTFWRR